MSVRRLSRRQLLGASAGLATVAALGRHLPVAAATARGQEGDRVPLTTDWLFGGRCIEGSTRPDYGDADFERVTLPHSAVDLSWRNWDIEAWEHRWIYRRHFRPPDDLANKRVFVDFEGALSAVAPTVNGTELEEHLGGYLPFSYELTDLVREGDNVLAVVLDGRWLDVPPSGHENGAITVDYLQPAGLYRDVTLRVVPQVFIDDVFAKPVSVLSAKRRVDVECTLDGAKALPGSARVEVRLTDGARVVATRSVPVELGKPGRTTVEATLDDLGDVRLWDVDDPHLYDVTATLIVDDERMHEYATRIGFRDARFEADGFYLNGRHVKLFGLNRHQTYPYTGMAMPDRVQRRDAQILRNELNCNAVRCAHYPQSAAFMDACDELGLLVFEEIPGWQYVGDEAWQDLAVRDVETMIRRDRNRPSVVVWGVRINESANFPGFYARTEKVAKQLDDSRQTSGAMVGGLYSRRDFQHDVFAYNNYLGAGEVATLRPPLPDIPYYVTESVGSLDGAPLYRHTDPADVQARQAYLHAQVHNQAGSDDRYAGLVAWSAIDYQSINGGNRIYEGLKWNGVLDTFRMPKLGATIYRAQVDPRVRPVIEPAFFWDFGADSPEHGPGKEAMVCSNCERLEVYVGDGHRATVRPAVARFPYLPYPPSFLDLTVDGASAGELRIDGYVDGERVLRRRFSADTKGDRLALHADDDAIRADGSDATRVSFRAVDRHGSPRPYVTGKLSLTVEGPGELVGDDPFDLGANGGVGAVWVRSVASRAGTVRLRAEHGRLGTAEVTVVTRQGS
ncbi:MAG: beta-galactosidase [Streptosporangiales bacterium]|nr:beta-galactosidase [Streptosporangiales bacterium]